MKSNLAIGPKAVAPLESGRRARLRVLRPPAKIKFRNNCLEAVFTHAADGILVHDLKGRILDANAAVCQLMGYTRKELLALHPWDLVINASRKNMMEGWQTVQFGRPVVVERTYRCKNGQSLTVEARLIRVKSGRQSLIIVICRDLSGSKRCEELLSASQQLAMLAEAKSQSALLEERNRLARDIHDTVAQGFTGIVIHLETALETLKSGPPGETESALRAACSIARQSLKEVRRAVLALRPQSLADGSLPKALHQLITQMTSGTHLRGSFHVLGEARPLPPIWEENLLRIGQEALTNALKYSQAESFEAQLAFKPDGISLSVHDDGLGFNTADDHFGFGLVGMKQRVEQMGGKLTIQSEAGLGTRIDVQLTIGQRHQHPG